MQAAVLLEPGRLEHVELPEPPGPAAGEALVAVRRVGVCGTDFHAYASTQNFFAYPRVLGHELAVEVLELGPGSAEAPANGSGPVRVGDRCAVMPYLSCGACTACGRGQANCCERIDVLGVTVDGGMRERLLVPVSALYARPGLSLDQLALVETLGIGMHAVRRAEPVPSDTVLVIGAGPIGLAVAQCVRDAVDSVVLSDLSPARLAFAERTTALVTLPAGPDLPDVLRKHLDGDLPTLVFDATGSKTSMETAFELVGAGGKLVLVGHTTGPLTFANPLFHRRELDVRASRNALASEWATVLDRVAGATLDALPWIGRRSSLAAISDDLPELAGGTGGPVKVIVDIDPDIEPDGGLEVDR
jgi:threonine dehydrogenase-like Zn-dependent dehydrogenase